MKMTTLLSTLFFVLFNCLNANKEQEQRMEKWHREEFRKTCYKIAAISSASTLVVSFAGTMLAQWAFHEIKNTNNSEGS